MAEYKAEEKAGKSKDELCSLVQASARDYSYLDDEVIAAETTYLYEIAYRLRVPTPDYGRNDLWTTDTDVGVRKLTDAALTDFRTAIRKERMERWQYWELRLKVFVVLITGLTGLIGALIGLIATYKR